MAPDATPLEAFRRLREVEGDHTTIIDLYRLASEPRGLPPQKLPLDERVALANSAMPFVWPGFTLTEGSERADPPIVVAEYDPSWPAVYQSWRKRIGSELDGVARRIEHVGSTAVEGL
ncbi:MAG TPA: GrpB family protein, partial [Candidatus Dormibacteraeota bacterium]|nr:GrpB family protein [Candidatus Dormibacteraeota bacterium]